MTGSPRNEVGVLPPVTPDAMTWSYLDTPPAIVTFPEALSASEFKRLRDKWLAEWKSSTHHRIEVAP